MLFRSPTGNLDRTNAVAIGRLLLEMQQREHAMLIVVTHSVELAGLFQRQLILDNGCLRTP